MSSDSVQLTGDGWPDPPRGTVPRPGPAGPWVGAAEPRGSSVCCPANRTRLTAVCTVLPLPEVDVAGRPALPRTQPRAQDAGPEPPLGACTGSRVTAIQYLSVCVDNQRINDVWGFFTQWFVERVEMCPPAVELSLGKDNSGQDAAPGPHGEPWRRAWLRHFCAASGQTLNLRDLSVVISTAGPLGLAQPTSWQLCGPALVIGCDSTS